MEITDFSPPATTALETDNLNRAERRAQMLDEITEVLSRSPRVRRQMLVNKRRTEGAILNRLDNSVQ